MTQVDIINLVAKGLPNSINVKWTKIDDPSNVRFKWCGKEFKITSNLMVEEVQDSFLCSSTEALLIQHCLRLTKKIYGSTE